MSAQAIFLSYSSDDADAARRICDALRAAGLEVWFDQSELRGGDAWDASIRKQIKECALFVPIISANTNARPEGYFRLEWKLAVDRSHLMADDQPFFVPVILDGTPEPSARVPEKFRERQWTRLNDDASTNAFAERVAKLMMGSASSGKSALNAAPNGELTRLTVSSKLVAPAKAGVQVSSPSHEHSKLDPGLRRDDNVKVIANAEQTTLRPRRTYVIAAIATLVAIACAATAWFVIDQHRKQTFIAQSLTNIESLSRSTKFMEAYRLAREVERAGGAALLTDAIRKSYSRAVDVTSTPEGAAISFREYRPQANEEAWIDLGTAPMTGVRVPGGVLEWRATLPQRASHTLVASGGKRAFSLPAAGAKNADMLPVPEGEISIGGMTGLKVEQGVKLKPFAIDRTEVTNRQYANFVQAGGYAREEFWKHSFQDGAKALSFSQAMARFKDATGRAGPANWKLGSFPDGEGELPVRGISWHEASAYAAFAGKALPTIYHWYFADSGGDFFNLVPAVLPSANFEGKGPRAAATSRAIGAFGAIDMAGNVREWVATPTDKGHRIAVGGSWLEVDYQYKYGSQLSAFDRPADVGFRCMTNVDAVVASDVAYAPVTERPARDTSAVARVSDAEYAVYARFFEQSRVPLDARVESTDASKPHWTRLKVNYATGYGNERMNAYLYLPKRAAPPFQTVIFVPGSGVFDINKSYDDIAETAAFQNPEMLIRGGRAVLYPIWKGSFERSDGMKGTRASRRQHLPQWVSEMRQSVEFLRSRQEVDAERIGYFGYSFGALWAPNFLAMEPRLKAAVLLAGGLDGPMANGETLPPEIDSATYAPRTKAAVLMLNGRSDIRFPYETSQVPLFNLLGSPPGKKKHKTYPGGHSVLGWYDDMVKDTHDWFDEQFGPVRPAAPTSGK